MKFDRFLAGRLIAVVALITSAVTAFWFVGDHGGDLLHQLATPFCLEALALLALACDRKWLFVPPFLVAVVVNVAHPWPNYVLSAVHALPPIAAVMAGHMLLHPKSARRGTRKTRTPARSTTRRPQPVDTPVDTQAHSNGHRPVTRKATIGDLRRMFPDTPSIDAHLAAHDTHEAAWAAVGASRDQGNKLRRQYREQGV